MNEFSIIMKLNISFQAHTKTVIGEQALKSQNDYIEALKMILAIGCFDGTFSLQVKADSKPYQAPQRYVTFVLQKPFKEEVD